MSTCLCTSHTLFKFLYALLFALFEFTSIFVFTFYTEWSLFDVSRFFDCVCSMCMFFVLVFLFILVQKCFDVGRFSSSFSCTPDPNTNEQNYYLWTFIVWISFILALFSEIFVATVTVALLLTHVVFRIQGKKTAFHFFVHWFRKNKTLDFLFHVCETANIRIRNAQTLFLLQKNAILFENYEKTSNQA